MSKILAGKVAVVTGSTSGIGLGIARAFADEGADILLNGLGDPIEIEKTRSDLEAATGVKVLYHPANMLNPAEIEDMIKTAVDKLGGVHILVNNAGIQHVADIEQFPLDKWNAIISINLTAAFVAMKAAIPHMKAQDFGRIINISSAHGLVGSAGKHAYVAAKHGLLGLTKTVALDLAKKTKIRVTAICPGWVMTPLVEKQIRDRAAANGTTYDVEHAKLIDEKEPTGEASTVEEIGLLAVYLANPANKNTTGVHFSHDGGWTAE